MLEIGEDHFAGNKCEDSAIKKVIDIYIYIHTYIDIHMYIYIYIHTVHV